MSASAWHFQFNMGLYVSNGKFISILFLSNSLRETKINLKLSIWISYPSFSSLLHASENGACKTIESVNSDQLPFAWAIGGYFFADITISRWLWPLTTIFIFTDENWSHFIAINLNAINVNARQVFFHSKQRNCDKTESIWLYRLSGYFSIILVKRQKMKTMIAKGE